MWNLTDSYIILPTDSFSVPPEASNAVYDVLTGAYNPAGRTVVTW